MANLFPVFLKLDGRRCLLVGAGKVAEQKIAGLLSAGAEVHVVAPQASERIRQLAAARQVQWSARTFVPGDLDGVALVVAATSNAVVNGEIFRQAEARHVLCNVVDDPEHCSFYYPAVVRRGDLQIAISTAGNSPALAQRLRAELEETFGPEYGRWLRWLGAVRMRLFRRPLDPQRRRLALHRLASQDGFERYLRAQQRNPEG
jgi:precorrin-2 dehydrogenase/sirohydrochlorin ferrochelatase